MIKTQLESTSSSSTSATAEDPLSRPETAGTTAHTGRSTGISAGISTTADNRGAVPDLKAASTTVTVVVPEYLDAENFDELLSGAAESTRILGLEELHIIAPAQHLPALAVAAAEIAHQLPEKFQFCEAETCTHVHPDDDTYLTVESLVQLGKKLSA
ncbi:hypothetical protein SFC07_05365 [Corynebacterium callunae]|uniref:hypothetical protein n=1 Tax=Corynebacterium callunae TaxID=1721 RepID=UPI0039824286